MKKFKAGDVVKLNSGGPRMTVIRVTDYASYGPEVHVQWSQGTSVGIASFPYACVTKVSTD